MKTFDEILSEVGYSCAYYGKWHSALFHGSVYENEVAVAGRGATELGRGMKKQYLDYLDKNFPKRALKPGEFYDTYTERPYTPDPIDRRYNLALKGEDTDIKVLQPDLHGCLDMPREHSITAVQAKETIAAIERLKDKPFSITCSFHLPHAPMVPTPPYCNLYPPDKMLPPASIHDKMENTPYLRTNGRLDKPEYADIEKIRYMMSNYYGLVKEIDDWVGKILDKLDELKLSDNTLVIFTSDHGEMLGAHGMREKNVFYEESAHIPLMIRFPNKIKPKRVVDGYVSTVDLFASILDYLGLKDHSSDGKSLRGLIEGTDRKHGKYVVTEWLYNGSTEPNYMIVKDGWKMFIPWTAESEVLDALYHLNSDPFEMNNLLGNNPKKEQYKEKVEELRADLLEWLKRTHSAHYEGVRNRKLM